VTTPDAADVEDRIARALDVIDRAIAEARLILKSGQPAAPALAGSGIDARHDGAPGASGAAAPSGKIN
jgi:hypothetical protein